jgi:MFS superfamily sulfate permease-like transporter
MKPEFLKQDLLASVVVFLVALPLCMGIALASGVPPVAGLITGIIGGLVVGSISGCPLQVSGPAAGLAVVVYEIVQQHGLQTLAAAVLLAGCIQVFAGFARAGQLFRAISPSVIYGMLAGIGILIFGAQFHVMVDDKPREDGLRNLLAIPEAIYKGVWPVEGGSHHLAAFIGIGTIAILIGWPRFAPRRVKWIPGALVAVAAATAVSAIFSLPIRRVTLPENILAGVNWFNWNTISSGDAAGIILIALTMAFVASAETLLSAAAVDQMHDGSRTNYDRELVAQGAGNMLCGLVGALPMTGVIVRSATNVAAGAKTRRSAMLHGAWLLGLTVAVPWLLCMVPTASLAAVLVYTGYKLVNVQNIRRLLRYGGAPVIIYAATVVGIVATNLLTGILTGIGLSIIKVMYARTHFHIRTEQSERLQRTDVYLTGAASFLRLPMLSDVLDRIPARQEVHVHFRDLDYVDDAALEVLTSWEQQRRRQGSSVVLEWDEALRLYREKNPLGQYQRADIEASTSAHL